MGWHLRFNFLHSKDQTFEHGKQQVSGCKQQHLWGKAPENGVEIEHGGNPEPGQLPGSLLSVPGTRACRSPIPTLSFSGRERRKGETVTIADLCTRTSASIHQKQGREFNLPQPLARGRRRSKVPDLVRSQPGTSKKDRLETHWFQKELTSFTTCL